MNALLRTGRFVDRPDGWLEVRNGMALALVVEDTSIDANNLRRPDVVLTLNEDTSGMTVL